MSDARADLARRIAGEVVLSDDPGATMRRWRTDFEVAQTDLADHLDVSPSVVSDYESGRRSSPGIAVVRRVVEGLLDIDEARGGEHVRQYTRVLSAGFESDVVYDLREYPMAVPVHRFIEAVDGAVVGPNAPSPESDQVGRTATIAGHTVINSIEAITRLSSEDFIRLYGQSTNRALVFAGVTRGESPLVALRVVTPTPTLVVLHGITTDELWEHAPKLARADGYTLVVTDLDLQSMLERLRELA